MGRALTPTILQSAIEASDETLASAAAHGDMRAYRSLYQRHVGRVRAVIARMGVSAELDDTTQEVFIRAWRALAQIREGRYFATWLYRIAINTAIDVLRAGQMNSLFVIDSPLFLDARAAAQEPIDTELARRELMAVALDTLSHDHRSVLILHDLEGFSMGEIATMLEIPQGTVKSRLFYARRTVRQTLESRGVKP